ncbi:hypothetical protein [Nocardioides daphniae]|nr:hypothetical protein [Nocardioides daphniae]
MTAARIHGHSLPAIARHFDRDHTTVLVRDPAHREDPAAAGPAAKIAADLPEQPAASSAPATSSSMSPSPVTAPPACASSSERSLSPLSAAG